MNVTENRDALYWHLTAFYNTLEYQRKGNPDIAVGVVANLFLDDQIAQEKGMKDYYDYLREIDKYNNRILAAVKSVRGKTFYKHLLSFLEEAQPCDYAKFEIVSQPTGKEQSVSEFGRAITKEWVTQRAVGDSGDSWEGTICIQLKPNKYLRFQFSM